MSSGFRKKTKGTKTKYMNGSDLSNDPHVDGYLLKYSGNKPYTSKAVIPRRGLPGNKDGKRVCISLRRNLKKKDGLRLDDRWVRYYFAMKNGKLSWQRIHTEITSTSVGKMMHETVKEGVEDEMDVRDAEVIFHDNKVFGKENTIQISSKTRSVYLSCESMPQAELWIRCLQKAMIKEHCDSRLKARPGAFKGRKPVCIFTGTDKGPWQQAPKLSELHIPAPHLTVGNRASTEFYNLNKQVRHVQLQYQLDYPASKKHGMFRSLPRSFPMVLPPALAQSPVGLQIRHSLAHTLKTTGI